MKIRTGVKVSFRGVEIYVMDDEEKGCFLYKLRVESDFRIVWLVYREYEWNVTEFYYDFPLEVQSEIGHAMLFWKP